MMLVSQVFIRNSHLIVTRLEGTPFIAFSRVLVSKGPGLESWWKQYNFSLLYLNRWHLLKIKANGNTYLGFKTSIGFNPLLVHLKMGNVCKVYQYIVLWRTIGFNHPLTFYLAYFHIQNVYMFLYVHACPLSPWPLCSNRKQKGSIIIYSIPSTTCSKEITNYMSVYFLPVHSKGP